MMLGNFFCEYCQEVQFVRFTGPLVIKCPTCHKPQCRWIVDAVNHNPHFKRVKPVSFERGQQLLSQLKNSIKAV
jgi:hypothetical protein